jgi:hypothetical protein
MNKSSQHLCFLFFAALTVSAGTISFHPITNDADSGISSAKDYTHAIDFGSHATVATINGVAFGDGNPGAFPGETGSQTVGTGTSTLPSNHGGNLNAPATGDIQELLRDMIFGDATGDITLTGLTPGAQYQLRLYNRAFGAVFDRSQSIGFNTDGIGTNFAGAEDTGVFNPDDNSAIDASLASFDTVNALTYDYTLTGGATSLTIYINQTGGGSYHLYGLSNEKVSGAPNIVTQFPVDDATAGVLGDDDLFLSFDEAVQKGTGNIVIKRTADNSTFETIDVTSGLVTVSGTDVTINPIGTMLTNTGYYVQIDAGAIESTAAEVYPGIADTTSWNFEISPILFTPINGDGDSGLNSLKTYTHAVDFGTGSPAASVNGVQFQTGKPGFGPIAGTAATIGTGTSSVPNQHGGNGTADPYLDGAAFASMEDLVEDMTYNDSTSVITLTGLTPGQPYQFKLYNRPWGIGDNRRQDIGFDTDGVGLGSIAGAEHTTLFNADDASEPDPSFASAAQVYALTYDYTPTVSTLTIYINQTGGGSYHLYGLTNEQLNPPSISSLVPADDETDVGLVSNLIMTFVLDVAKDSGNIEIRKTIDDSLVETIDVNSGLVTVSGNTLTVDPSVNLDVGTDYYVLIDNGAIVSLPGIAFPGISVKTDWNFVTAAAPDTTPPAIASLLPGNNSDNIAGATDLVFSFNEFVQKGSGNIEIRRDSDDVVVETIAINSGTVTVAGAEVTVDRVAGLAANSTFYVNIAAGAIQDLSGNAYAGISNKTSWSFTIGGITYEPITGDADSGISSTKTYTHAIDFGTNTVATVNGVVFGDGNPGAFPGATGSQTVGTGSSTIPNNNGGTGGADGFLTAGGMRTLMRDMIFNDTTALITLTGLTPGQEYQVRLYNRAWGLSTRRQSIGFDTDGSGTSILQAEATGSFYEDDAREPDPSLDVYGRVNAVTYTYTLAAGVTQLKIYVDTTLGDSYHFYGITNEEFPQPRGTVIRFR